MNNWRKTGVSLEDMTVKELLDNLTDENWHTERMVIEAIIDGRDGIMGEALLVWLGHRTYGYLPDELGSLRKKVYDEIERI